MKRHGLRIQPRGAVRRLDRLGQTAVAPQNLSQPVVRNRGLGKSRNCRSDDRLRFVGLVGAIQQEAEMQLRMQVGGILRGDLSCKRQRLLHPTHAIQQAA